MSRDVAFHLRQGGGLQGLPVAPNPPLPDLVAVGIFGVGGAEAIAQKERSLLEFPEILEKTRTEPRRRFLRR